MNFIQTLQLCFLYIVCMLCPYSMYIRWEIQLELTSNQLKMSPLSWLCNMTDFVVCCINSMPMNAYNSSTEGTEIPVQRKLSSIVHGLSL
jgi:hypothetical protein